MKLSNSQFTTSGCFHYSTVENRWQEYKKVDYKIRLSENKAYKLTTYNILDGVRRHKPFYRYLRGDKIRFEYIFRELIPSLNADILTLNEVTPTSIAYLLENKLIMEEYFLSDIRGKSNIILSKVPFDVFEIDQQKVVGVFETENGACFATCSLHLRHLEEKEYALARNRELKNTLKVLETSQNFRNRDSEKVIAKIQRAFDSNNIVILGDLNFHNLGETDFLYNQDFSDVWLNIKGIEDPGFTWDADENLFVSSWLKLDNRRMRLDRIAVKYGSSLRFSDIQIVANNKILKANFLCPRVHASDHFGLESVFEITNESINKGDLFDYFASRATILGEVSPWRTGFRRLRSVILFRKLFCTFASLFIVAIFFLILTILTL